MTTLTATAVTKLYGTYAGAPDIGAASQSFSDAPSYALTDGTGNGQAQKYFEKTYTVAASGTQSIDLSGGITDIFGTTLTLTKVKMLRIRAAAGNTNNVVVGGAASNTWIGPFGGATHTVSVQPGGEMFHIDPNAGWTVTAGTGDILQVANSSSGTSVTFTIEVVGI